MLFSFFQFLILFLLLLLERCLAVAFLVALLNVNVVTNDNVVVLSDAVRHKKTNLLGI